MVFSLASQAGELRPYTLDNFRQVCPEGWLPGCVSRWDHEGIEYQVSVIMVPHQPEPIDIYEIVLTNTSDRQAQANLVVTIDGAPGLKAEGDLISDRGKPLMVMAPSVPTERIARDSGVVDLRCTGTGAWEIGNPGWDLWRIRRDGYYGMPIEYMLKVGRGETLQVFLGYGGTPPIPICNWDIPAKNQEPDVLELHQTSKTNNCYRIGDIWKMIFTNAHATGEPGACFIDRVNEDNPTPNVGDIHATNPCGEQPLLDYESCTLGSVNIAKFILPDGSEMDREKLGQTVTYGIRFLDNVNDANDWPIDPIRQISLGNRIVGLGIMGFADALILLPELWLRNETQGFS